METLARRGDPLQAIDLNTAKRMRQRAEADAPGYMAELGTGSELIPASIMGENSRALELADTVRDPNYVTVDASRDRLELANEAGALETALDAAESIGAGNSLEKMLAHQLAAAHRSAMKMSAEMNRRVEYLAHVRGEEQERANIQTTRLASASARMMTAFQQGLLTLQRLRTGGQQVVTVQHVQVNEGGQAVVAGTMGRGSRKQKMRVLPMDRDADPRADTLMPADSGQEDFSLAEMDPDAAAAIKAIVTNPSLRAADVPGYVSN